MTLKEYREDRGGGIETYVDDNGYLRVDGIAARSGILTYALPDGTVRREFVPESTLFDPESMASLRGAPVTIGHEAVLNADNVHEFSQGSVPEAKADTDRLRVGLVVTSRKGIDAIRGGTRQLSPGYQTELDPTPGEHEGQRYDAVQVRRVYNHLALVSEARGGSECRLNLDGFNRAVEVETTEEVIKMPTVKLRSGATVEVADASTASALQTEINQLSLRADEADNSVPKADYEEQEGKLDAAKAEIENLKEAATKISDASAMIGEYVALLEEAREMNPDIEINADGKYLSKEDLMAAAMGIKADGKSPEYLKGRFDSAREMGKRENIRQQRDDSKDDGKTPELTGRAKFIAEQTALRG